MKANVNYEYPIHQHTIASTVSHLCKIVSTVYVVRFIALQETDLAHSQVQALHSSLAFCRGVATSKIQNFKTAGNAETDDELPVNSTRTAFSPIRA